MDEPEPPRFDPRRRTAVLVALLLVTSVAAFEGTVVSTAMPTIIGDLSGLSLYSWVFSIYLLTSTVTMPLYGRLADLHGRRRLGPSSMAQVLAIQHATRERERGVATALVPFFGALGGALGVGALGALLATGLSLRLGPAAETAGRLLAGHRDSTSVAAPALRAALEQSLLPVFVLLLVLACVHIAVTGWFPGRADAAAQPAPAPEAMEQPAQV